MLVVFSLLLSPFDEADNGLSSDGVGGASLRGGMRSLIASRPFASANDVILWFGENPCNAEKRKLKIKIFHKTSRLDDN